MAQQAHTNQCFAIVNRKVPKNFIDKQIFLWSVNTFKIDKNMCQYLHKHGDVCNKTNVSEV